MNATMHYLCANIQGCVYGYCQSDEISLVVTDMPKDEKSEGTSFFGYRLCKIQSICASLATSCFNNIMLINLLSKIPECMSSSDMKQCVLDTMKNAPLYEFDCKAWNAPNVNDAYAWLLYRQHDCVRNSKQQAAQTYFQYKDLVNLNTDEQIKLLLDEKGIDWYQYEEGMKYGRICYKDKVQYNSPDYGVYERRIWNVEAAKPFNDETMREEIYSKIEVKTEMDK